MDFLAAVGAVTLVVIALRVLYFVYFYALMPGANLAKYGGRGAWAVVTGASDGIGKAYVHELARRGFNVVMVSRTHAKMAEIANEVKTKFGADTRIVAVDAAANTPDTWSKVDAALRDVTGGERSGKLTMLVNNVGTTIYPICPYSEMSAAQVDELINVNAVFSAKMTSLCLPLLLANKNSAIIELSSLFAQTAAPFNALYSATKAFNSSLAQTLAVELKRNGCDVLCVKPGYVATNMTKFRRTSLAIIWPDRLVKSSLHYLGRVSDVSPYWFHGIERMLLNTVPTPILNAFVLNKMTTARKAQLRKIAAQAKNQ